MVFFIEFHSFFYKTYFSVRELTNYNYNADRNIIEMLFQFNDNTEISIIIPKALTIYKTSSAYRY